MVQGVNGRISGRGCPRVRTLAIAATVLTVLVAPASSSARTSLSDLENRLEALEAAPRPAQVVDAQGSVLGQYAGGDDRNIQVLTPMGYEVILDRATGEIGPRQGGDKLFFDGPDCTGNAHIGAPAAPFSPSSTIVELLVGDPRFTALVAALEKTGLADDINNAEFDLTLLAPNNEAFAALGFDAEIIEQLDPTTPDLTQIVLLRRLLLTNLIRGSNDVASLLASTPVQTLDERFIEFLRGAPVAGIPLLTRADIPAANGVIHYVDEAVLLDGPRRVIVSAVDPAEILYRNRGKVFSLVSPGGAPDVTRYVPAGAEPAPGPLATASSLAGEPFADCASSSAESIEYYGPVLPNDPAVTGVPAVVEGPLSIVP